MFLILATGAALLLASLLSYAVAMALVLHVTAALVRRGYRGRSFWRNVAVITLVHVLALIALLRWVGASKIESAQEITWLSADEDTSASIDSPKPEETPTPEKPALPEENQSVPAPAKSEIQLPAATPHPTPSASTTPTRRPPRSCTSSA